MFIQLKQLLEEQNANFRVIEHPPEGKSQSVAQIRGTSEEQGAKAMLCKSKHDPNVLVLAVLPGNKRLDFQKVASAMEIKKATLASPKEATAETGCQIGAIPPFTFSSRIHLLVDPALVEEHYEIAFNAGRLDRSIVLNTQDYLRIAKPELHSLWT